MSNVSNMFLEMQEHVPHLVPCETRGGSAEEHSKVLRNRVNPNPPKRRLLT